MGKQLDAIIEQFRSSLRSFEDETHIANYITSSSGERKYIIGLAEVLKNMTSYENTPASPQRQEQAIEKWNKSILLNDYTNVSKKELRILCGVPEVVRAQEFINFIYEFQQKNPLSSRMTRALVQSYHCLWNNQQYSEHLEVLLLRLLNDFDGKNNAIHTWKSHLSKIVGVSAPDNLAEEVIESLIEPDKLCEKYFLFSENTAFFKEILRSIAVNLSNNISNSIHYDKRYWDYLFQNILKHNHLYKDYESIVNVFTVLIEFLDKKTQFQDREIAEGLIKDFLLTHEDFKDPRLNTGKWHYFEQNDAGKRAKEILMSWLSKEDIAFFFEFIIKNDPHGRKPFWLDYLNKIKGSRVIIGDNDQSIHWSKLQELKNKGRDFAYGERIKDTSAFLLDFGEYIVVEFSARGNACYMYESKVFINIFKNFYKSTFDMKDLKDPTLDKAIYREVHNGNWQWRLRQQLAGMGIRKN